LLCLEGGIPVVFFFDSYLVVSQFEIQFDEVLATLQLIQHLIDPMQRKSILHGDPI
jgi:hypothetical protein